MSGPLSTQFSGKKIDFRYFETPIASEIKANDFIGEFSDKMDDALLAIFPGQQVDTAPLKALIADSQSAKTDKARALSSSLQDDDAPVGVSPMKAPNEAYITAVDGVRTRAIEWLKDVKPLPAAPESAPEPKVPTPEPAPEPKAKLPEQVPPPAPKEELPEPTRAPEPKAKLPEPVPVPVPKAKLPAPVPPPAPKDQTPPVVAAKTYSVWRAFTWLLAVVATITLSAYVFKKYVRPGI